MPGLQYDTLPAGRQDPTEILKGRFNKQYDLMHSQYKSQARAIGSAGMDRNRYQQSMNELNTKNAQMLDKFKYESNQKMQQVQRMQTLIAQGQVTEVAGKEAMWRMVLPKESQAAMFPDNKGSKTPYSMSQMRGAISDSIMDFAERSADTPGLEWGAPKKTKDSLVNQYSKWRELIGYDQMNPVRQNQLDLQWDAYMRTEKKFKNWWTDENKRRTLPEISASRPQGKIGAAMRDRIGGSAVRSRPSTTPIGESVREQNKHGVYGLIGFGKPTVFNIPKEEKPKQAPSADQLRRTGTQESYEMGIELGYWKK